MLPTKLITAATSEDYSTLPDIFLMQDYSFHKMVANFPGIYTELTDSGLDWDKFSGGKLADSTVDGHHYGLPFDNGASVMAVRSDMIENAGLTVDDFKDLTAYLPLVGAAGGLAFCRTQDRHPFTRILKVCVVCAFVPSR